MSVHISEEAAREAYQAMWHDQCSALDKVPSYMHAAFYRWVVWGIEGGDFLQAFVRNDLMGAMRKADDENRAAMFDWVTLFYNGAPAACFGADRLAARWHDIGGIAGRCEGCGGHLSVPGIEASTRADIKNRHVCIGCLEEYNRRIGEEQAVAADMEAEG